MVRIQPEILTKDEKKRKNNAALQEQELPHRKETGLPQVLNYS